MKVRGDFLGPPRSTDKTSTRGQRSGIDTIKHQTCPSLLQHVRHLAAGSLGLQYVTYYYPSFKSHYMYANTTVIVVFLLFKLAKQSCIMQL